MLRAASPGSQHSATSRLSGVSSHRPRSRLPAAAKKEPGPKARPSRSGRLNVWEKARVSQPTRTRAGVTKEAPAARGTTAQSHDRTSCRKDLEPVSVSLQRNIFCGREEGPADHQHGTAPVRAGTARQRHTKALEERTCGTGGRCRCSEGSSLAARLLAAPSGAASLLDFLIEPNSQPTGQTRVWLARRLRHGVG